MGGARLHRKSFKQRSQPNIRTYFCYTEQSCEWNGGHVLIHYVISAVWHQSRHWWYHIEGDTVNSDKGSYIKDEVINAETWMNAFCRNCKIIWDSVPEYIIVMHIVSLSKAAWFINQKRCRSSLPTIFALRPSAYDELVFKKWLSHRINGHSLHPWHIALIVWGNATVLVIWDNIFPVLFRKPMLTYLSIKIIRIDQH